MKDDLLKWQKTFSEKILRVADKIVGRRNFVADDENDIENNIGNNGTKRYSATTISDENFKSTLNDNKEYRFESIDLNGYQYSGRFSRLKTKRGIVSTLEVLRAASARREICLKSYQNKKERLETMAKTLGQRRDAFLNSVWKRYFDENKGFTNFIDNSKKIDL
ncbi:hypothetical protein MHBO_001634 [Bonamia ostreae]|uniref:Uncharacterized protein n=1 Tax=Bonamia ostreae TaxID=126728 RepID=A0ABV2AKT2_9EUKA